MSEPATDDTPWTIEAAAAALRAGSVTSVELVRAAQAAADALDDTLGTWLDRYDESALERAAEADRELAAGDDPGSPARHPPRGEGHHRHRRRPDHRPEPRARPRVG